MRNDLLKIVVNPPRRSGTPPEEGILFSFYSFPSSEGWPQAGVGRVQSGWVVFNNPPIHHSTIPRI